VLRNEDASCDKEIIPNKPKPIAIKLDQNINNSVGHWTYVSKRNLWPLIKIISLA
jgi:hypothetical protein